MADPRTRHWFTGLVVLTAVVTTAVFAHVGWRLVRDGGAAKSFGWSETSHRGVSYVASVEPQGEAGSALRPGDRLVRLNGDPHVARAGSAFHRRALAAGDTYRLRIARHGQEHEHTLVVGRTTTGAALRVTLFLVSLVWCAVGLFIAFARPDTALARLAFAAAMATGSVFMTIGFFPGVVLWAPLHAVIGYHFFSRFPAGVPPEKAWSRLVPLLYAAGGLAVGVGQTLNVAYLAHGPTAASRLLAEQATLFTIRDGLGISAFWLAVGGMVAVLARNYRVLSDADQRRRIRWVLYGSMVGLVPSLVWSALAAGQFIFGEGAVPWSSDTWMRFSVIVDAASVAIPICIAYAVVKHRVLDIKVAVRAGVQYMLAKRALQLLLVLPVIGLAYTVITNRDLTMTQLATESTGYLYWGGAAALGLRVRHRLGVWLDRKFFREQYDREQVLLGLIEDLGALDSLSEASYLIRTQLDVALHPKVMDLWYREADKLVLAASSRATRDAPPLPPDTGLLAQLERKASLLDVRELRRSELFAQDRRWLDEAEVHLIAPVLGSDDRLLGLLILGEKRSEEPYSASDRRLLQAIARHAGVMRENLQLRGQVNEHRRVRRDVLAHFEQRLINVMKECPSCGTCFDSETDVCDRDGQPLTLPLPVERTIDSKYRLDCLIGKGGMGAVYSAWDLRLQRQVAVKVLIGHAFSHETAARRFQREARAAARLSHPNIVRVYDYGTLGGDGAYLVMERVHGRTLREELTRFGRLSPADAARWLEQLLDGVTAAHALGIVHRDLKPDNIVGERQTSDVLNVKVLDFGLAKFTVPDAAVSGTLTATGLIMGSIGYMSPEQLTGSEVDHRTDIFALGIIVAEVLTGRRPFAGVSHGELLRAVLLDPYHLPVSSAETRALDDLLQRCLAKEPEARLESVATMRAELIPLLRACPSDHLPHASAV